MMEIKRLSLTGSVSEKSAKAQIQSRVHDGESEKNTSMVYVVCQQPRLGERLRNCVVSVGFSEEEFGKEMGLPSATLNKWWGGSNSILPTPKQLQQASEVLDVPVEMFMCQVHKYSEDMWFPSLCRNFKHLYFKRNCTLKEMVEVSGLSVEFIQSIESGEKCTLTQDELVRLCYALHCEESCLLEFDI